jgi:putative ABC transport system permease protein
MIGASRKRIFGEILYEAAAIFAISLFMAWILAIEFSPVITHITGISFSKSLLNSPVSFTLSFLVAIVLSFMASLIPAWRMASSDPVFNLKKQQSASRNKSAAREYLVVSQFAVAIVLIAFTLLIQKQIRFGSKNLGFDKENILVIKITDQLSGKIDVLRQYFSEQPLVRKLSFSQFYPGKEFSSWRVPLKENGEEKQVTFNIFSSDANFFDLMETVLVQGRYFTNDISTDRNKVVVNEAFVKQYEMTDPIGSTFNDGQNEIIGVVKDFHYMPVNKPIEPLAIVCKEWASTCLARPAKNEYAVLHPFLENVKKKCAELSPAFPVEIHFLDTAVENMYRQEVQFRRTFTLFAGCAMFICCLGMLALSLIVSQQRIKEIGIRKIVGATSGEIVYLLLSHSLKWVGIAFLIASPVAWYMMNRWLQNFVYRTSVSWWLFILAGLFTLVIAVLTVSWQAVKAARANPANSLKYE